MNRALLALLLAASVAAIAQDPKAKPADPKAKVVTTPAPAAKSAPAAATAIVANKDSKIYHRADCKSVGKMKDTNKMSFASGAEAAKAGYKPCKVCKP